MTFDKILPFIKQGDRVARKKWGTLSIKSNGDKFEIDEYTFKILTHDDIFADDWEVYKDKEIEYF